MTTPLRFKSISIRNFLSFGNVESVFDLEEQGSVEVVGENLDKGGSNGSGKTTLINALCYALYNKAFDSISLQRLINTTNAKKNTLMEVRLVFTKGEVEYEIYRARGEDYRIEVRRDGVNITPGKGVTETDAMIEEIIGISYDLFTKTIIFSGNSPAFLQLPIHQQRTQIEELFNITILSEKAKKLKDIIRQTEQDIKVAEAVVQQQDVAVALYRKHLKEAEQRVEKWSLSTLNSIEDIEQTLEKISRIDFEGEQALHDEKNELQQRGAYLAAKLAPARKDRSILTSKVADLMKEQEHLADAKCPYCAQTFADAPDKLKSIEAELEVRGNKLLEVEDLVKKLQEEEDTRIARLNEVKGQIKYNDLPELQKARTNSAVLQERLAELKAAENPHFEAYEKLEAEGEPAIDTTKVDKLHRKLDHMNFLLKLLVDKNSFIRRRIISKTIPFLNKRLNYYTSFLGLPHVVKFDADMSCTVSEFDRELDFGNLSAGEKKRVNSAMALAFRDVLHHLHAKTNLLIVDELDGQLDVQGIEAIVKVLKGKARDEDTSVFIISHHPVVQGRLDRELKIRKKNGFSSVVFD